MHLGKIAAAVATAVTLALFASPSMAAQATTNVNVRATPGGAIVDVMQRGERADIVRRSGSWCAVDRNRGRDGWVSCQYLADDGRGPDRDRPGRPGTAQPNVSIEFGIPGFSFSIGSGGFDIDRPRRPGRPGGPDRRGEVCFYEHVNFGGASFCMDRRDRRTSLGAWNDRISSIRVRGGAEAQVCEHNNFQGRCVVIDRDVRNLGRGGNDIISSIRVR